MTKELIITIAIIVGAVAVLAVGFILISKYVLKKSNCKRHLRDLEKKFSYLKSLLTGQDSSSVRRLEIISRSNLLYGEIYDRYSTEFKQIFENECKVAEASLTKLRTLIVKKNYKDFKIQYSETKKLVARFEDALLVFDKNLYTTLKPEEDCRSKCIKVKEQYRIIKQKIADNADSLVLVKETFEKVFTKIEATFDKFEGHLECAEYQEAEELVPMISQVISALDKAVNDLPILCSQIEKIIPEKIMLLGNDFIDVEKSGIPLFHLAYKKRADIWNNDLVNIKEQLKELKISGAQSKLDNIVNEIEDLHKQLEQEILDKDFFEKNVHGAYEKVLELEKNFLKIVAVLPKVNSIYVISVSQQNNLEILKNNINDLGIAKRALDNYIHSATKQPFSVLKSKLDQLVADYEIAYHGVEDFKAYIESIKTNSEDAYSLVFNYFYRLKQTEYLIIEFNVPSLQSKYTESIERCYQLLNMIDEAVKTQPIDVKYVNEKVEELKSISNLLFDDVEKQTKDMKLAESAIVYNNNDRLQQTDVHEKLSLLEQDFFNGDFEKVYKSANEIYQSKHVEDKK